MTHIDANAAGLNLREVKSQDASAISQPETVVTTSNLHVLRGLPRWFGLVARIATKLEWGSITVIIPDGRRFKFEGQHPGHHATIRVKDMGFAGRLIRGGGIGFAEGFLQGEWDSPNLELLLEVIARNSQKVEAFFSGRPVMKFVQRMLHLLNKNSRSGSKRNISYHYDLGNDFYREWLDSTMTYSSAKFDSTSQNLPEAQLNKYANLAKLLDLKPGHRVLEIGCGWGGFAEYAAKNIGCDVVGVTISQEQLDFARQRIQNAGLSDKVDLRFQDYRDIDEKFDRVASIEMFEAVGQEYWPTFFDKVADSLEEGGRAALQIITIGEEHFETYSRNSDFIRRYIFPGGMLPSPTHLKDHARASGLLFDRNEDFGVDYADTLAIWRDRFLDAWPKISTMGFDDRFRRMWHYYLSYCEAGFRSQNIDVTQVAFVRG